MQPREPDDDKQWEDLVRRLGGDPDRAHTPQADESPEFSVEDEPSEFSAGPRDYYLTEEQVEDFRPPEPRPIASGNPRTVLSWFGVLGATALWIVAALVGWQLSWWLSTASILAFLGGALSLFFLLPKSWAHRDPFDHDDYGDGAKL